MSFPDDSRLQKVWIQLNLQIPDGCSQNTLYCSLRQRLIESFKTVPLFQVYFVGLGTQLWTLDAKMDNGAPCVKKTLRKKIRVPIQQAFAETLTQTAYATFKAWFDRRRQQRMDENHRRHQAISRRPTALLGPDE